MGPLYCGISENSTVLMLTNLKRVLVRCDIAMVELMRMSSIRSKYVDLMCMQCEAFGDYVDLICVVEIIWLMWMNFSSSVVI